MKIEPEVKCKRLPKKINDHKAATMRRINTKFEIVIQFRFSERTASHVVKKKRLAWIFALRPVKTDLRNRRYVYHIENFFPDQCQG